MTGVLARMEARVRPMREESPAWLVGEKAHTLGRMMRAGHAVPDGFVLTTPVFAARVRGAPMDSSLSAEIGEAAQPLFELGPLVVRSSAIGEDAPGQSFAGQLDSILHVADAHMLERAVLDCWDSYWSERALYYRRARGAPDAGMGVIVQQQIDARAAGVMFTDAGDGSVLVEYTAGLADALVAGAVDPSRLAFDRTTGRLTHLARGEIVLDEDVARALFATGLRLERELAGPQDVEWVLATDGTLYIVQSRPITAPVVRTEHSAPPASRVVWSNANVNENFPRPISPLLYSIASAGYTHYFRNLARAFGIAPRRVRAMEPAFHQTVGTHGARMYYNLTAIHSVLRLAPFASALTDSFDSFVGADGNHVEADTLSRTGKLRQLAEVSLVVAKTAWQYRTLGSRIERFEATVDAFAAHTHPSRLSDMSMGELRAALARFMDIRCHRWLDASLADCAAMVCYGALERLLARAYPDGSRASAHTSLLKAIPDVVSGEPVHRLWELSRLIRGDGALHETFERNEPTIVLAIVASDGRFAEFRRAFQQYLDDWGFRCSEELMLTTPSFQEEPAPLVEILRAYARIDAESPAEMLKRQAVEREKETARIYDDLPERPLLRLALRVVIPWTQAAVRFRERARLKQALLYSRCRRVALVLGDKLQRLGHLAEHDDVFFLTMSELDELASDTTGAPNATRELVAARKAEHARLSALTPPDAFTLEEGKQWQPAAQSAGETPSGDVLRGTSACGGRVTGRATVLRDVTEAARLAQGDILVTRQTDPGWAPVFFLISGLVIERGGMLSHGAIIAREFGLPCVVGVRDAMRLIPSGASITVYADTGEVHVLG